MSFGIGEAAPHHSLYEWFGVVRCSGVKCKYLVSFTNIRLDNVIPLDDLCFGSGVKHGIFTDYASTTSGCVFRDTVSVAINGSL